MDKIDPGPGYRLLEPPNPETGFKGELVQEGDEYTYFSQWRSAGNNSWTPVNWSRADGSQQGGLIYRRKLPAPTDAETHATKALQDAGVTSPSEAMESFANILSDLADPNAPKPFTPNKYTRYIPTLDGRTAPVDVYCVSEAFDLGTCLKSGGALDAMNHARKKLLAPGQRGTKSAIQDIKEAHASLGRAIAMEEAAMGREAP